MKQNLPFKPLKKTHLYEEVTDEIKKAILVGCSFGASVALDFTLQYPGYVNKLILVTPAVNGFNIPSK